MTKTVDEVMVENPLISLLKENFKPEDIKYEDVVQCLVWLMGHSYDSAILENVSPPLVFADFMALISVWSKLYKINTGIDPTKAIVTYIEYDKSIANVMPEGTMLQ